MGFLTKVAASVEKDPMPAAVTISAALGVILGIVVSKLVNKCDCGEESEGIMPPSWEGVQGASRPLTPQEKLDKIKNTTTDAKTIIKKSETEIAKARESIKIGNYSKAIEQAENAITSIATVGVRWQTVYNLLADKNTTIDINRENLKPREVEAKYIQAVAYWNLRREPNMQLINTKYALEEANRAITNADFIKKNVHGELKLTTTIIAELDMWKTEAEDLIKIINNAAAADRAAAEAATPPATTPPATTPPATAPPADTTPPATTDTTLPTDTVTETEAFPDSETIPGSVTGTETVGQQVPTDP